MFKRHCLWQPLRDVMVGRSYPAEFYGFIKDPHARRLWEKIADETEEDYQHLIALLESFGVNVVRPVVEDRPDWQERRVLKAFIKQFGPPDPSFPERFTCCLPPPMEPRDWFMMMDDQFIHWLEPEQLTHYQHILDHVAAQGNAIHHTDTNINAEGWITKMGRRLTYSLGGANWQKVPAADFHRFAEEFAPNYDNRFYAELGFADGLMRPIKPGVMVSLYESPRYAADFPGWDVIALPGDSWSKMDKWLRHKRKWRMDTWTHGNAGETARFALAMEWLEGGWQDYCSENVFDVNLLSVDENNVIVFNHNETVEKGLAKHGVNVHVSHFRHRYFWGGGIHCVTSDMNRDGVLEDYFN
jgi:hypothetical protein